MDEHTLIPPGQIHAPHQWAYADAAARNAAIITDANELDKIALQLDDGTYWRLKAVSPNLQTPATWIAFGAGGPANFGAEFLAWFNALPTVLPLLPGQMWNNGGVLSQS